MDTEITNHTDKNLHFKYRIPANTHKMVFAVDTNIVHDVLFRNQQYKYNLFW